MGDHILDTNVFVVANGRATHVPRAQKELVLGWLIAFGNDGQRRIVLDDDFAIWKEYRRNMGEQDIGWQVFLAKFPFAQFVHIEYDGHGHGQLPLELEKVVYDRADRKFVAAALRNLSEGNKSVIVVAADSGWHDWEA